MYCKKFVCVGNLSTNDQKMTGPVVGVQDVGQGVVVLAATGVAANSR